MSPYTVILARSDAEPALFMDVFEAESPDEALRLAEARTNADITDAIVILGDHNDLAPFAWKRKAWPEEKE